MFDSSPILFVDTASAVVSVALKTTDNEIIERTIETRRAAEQLLPTLEGVLQEAELTPTELAGIAAFQGPGSFTGLRIGLATVLGLHQALGIRATAIETLPVLAMAAEPADGPVIAAVDAIRGEWYAQGFELDATSADDVNRSAQAISDAGLKPSEELLSANPIQLVGFGISRLTEEPAYRPEITRLTEPDPLATLAARWLTPKQIEWEPRRLTAPIYFRPPSVTLPRH